MNLSLISEEFQNFFKLPFKIKPLIEKPIIKHIMRIGIVTIALLITTSAQLVFALPGNGQPINEVEIRIGLNNETLVQAFQKIEDQSPFHFMYRNEEVKNIRNLSLPVNKKSVEEFLKIVLAGTYLSYRQVNNQILIRPAKNLIPDPALKENELSYAPQANIVNGKITNSNGDPLSGVSITIKGTNIGTSTDEKGSYSISIPDEAILVFSYVGYTKQEIPVNGRTVINTSMVPSATSMDQVVVTALGIKRASKSLTYSTQSVNSQQLKEAREPNVIVALQGKVAGLSITESGGGLGSPARVILRGNRSISGDSQPLYVIDGMPINGDPTNISPDNIASINILKGPNAAALYGSAAQNGAIVITTYTGTAGVTNISFSSSYITQRPIMAVQFQNVYGQGTGGVYNKRSDLSWGPKMEGQMVEDWSPDPAQAGKTYAFTPQPDNVRDFFMPGGSLVNNLLLNMGGEKTQTVFSFTRLDAKGIVPNNELKRNNLSLRVNSKLLPKLSVDAKIDYTRQESIGGINAQGTFESSIENLYTIPRSIQIEQMKRFEYTDAQGANRQNYWAPGSAFDQNPYWRVYRNESTETSERVIALASLKYDFTRELNLMFRGAYDGINTTNQNKTYNDTYNRGQFGRYSVGFSNDILFNSDFLLAYKKNINKDWNVEANFGGNVRQHRNNGLNSNTGLAMTVPNFFALSNTQQVVSTYNTGNPLDVYSLYAFTHIGWKNAMFLDVTGRNDWSSTLPASNRSYFYPSVGLSAVLTDLIPSIRGALSYAKIRGSWAQVGNSAPPYSLERTASFSAGGNSGFLTLSSILPDTALRPELTKSVELGTELRFLNGRLGFELTLYKTNTTNQLFTVNLPVGSGASQYFTNGGNIQNKGIETMVFINPVQGKDFKWDINLNYSLNRNKVLKINDQRPRVDVGSISIEQGQPFGNIYRRGFLRDVQGRVIIGKDGVPKRTPGETIMVANFNPDWMGSISNSFSYKDFTLSFLIDHRQGGTILSQTNARLYGDGQAAGTLQGREGGLIFGQNFFTQETAILEDGSKNTIPINAEKFWTAMGGRVQSTDEIFVESATNTRLRELIIGYSLPVGKLGGLRISKVHLSLVGRNLFFIYRASKTVDPDLRIGTGPGTEGISGMALPTTRSIGVSLKVDFK
ncbi:MAG: TonB-dependent receptor plug [Ferruginibacter sp.]|nr:TonB-dependent receptor plug [Ferruginibacter sp.]